MASKAKVAGVLGLDPTLPDVSLKIGESTYRFCFDFNACAQVQALTGVNVFAVQSKSFDPVHFRAQLWASLLRDQPDITLEQAGALVTIKSMGPLAEAVAKAWTDSQAETTEGNE